MYNYLQSHLNATTFCFFFNKTFIFIISNSEVLFVLIWQLFSYYFFSLTFTLNFYIFLIGVFKSSQVSRKCSLFLKKQQNRDMVKSQFFMLFLLLVVVVNGTLYPSDKRRQTVKPMREFIVRTGPVDKNVIDRNLIEEEPSPEDIIIESGAYYKNTSLKNFQGTLLACLQPVSITSKNNSN